MYEILTALSILGFLAALFSASQQRRNLAVPFAFVLVVAAVVSVLVGYPVVEAAFGLSIAAVAVAMSFAYGSGRRFYPVALLVIADFVYIFFASMGSIFLFAQMMAIGTIVGFFYMELKDRKMQKRSNRNIEINRDIFQIALGVCFVAIALIFKESFKSAFIIAYLVIAAYLYNRVLVDYGRKTAIYKRLYALEREKTVYGLGAMYAAAGLLLLTGFINNYGFLAFGIFALFIGDPLATIVSHYVRLGKLFYNAKKSVSGTFVLFISTAVFGYLAIGLVAIPIAVAFAFFESADLGVDDNIILPIVAIASRLLTLLI